MNICRPVDIVGIVTNNPTLEGELKQSPTSVWYTVSLMLIYRNSSWLFTRFECTDAAFVFSLIMIFTIDFHVGAPMTGLMVGEGIHWIFPVFSGLL